jgi:hypothetical protein
MTPEQWQCVKSLFEAALERDENQRVGFVARSCPDDPEVRDEALRLLAESASVDSGFLAPPGRQTLLDRAARTLASNSAAGYEGQLLAGRYFVEREIGGVSPNPRKFRHPISSPAMIASRSMICPSPRNR